MTWIWIGRRVQRAALLRLLRAERGRSRFHRMHGMTIKSLRRRGLAYTDEKGAIHLTVPGREVAETIERHG